MKRRSSRQETAVKKKEMKIKVELLSNILNKVNAAVGGEDQLRIRFFPVSGKDAEGKDVTSNWVEFLAYSKGLQILQMMSYTGKAVANKETVLVVKASTLSGIVKSYMALGIEEATIEIKDNLLVVKNKQGQVTIPTAATMPVIDMAEAQKGAASQHKGDPELSKECGRYNRSRSGSYKRNLLLCYRQRICSTYH